MRHPFRRKNLSPRLLPLYAVAALAWVLAQPTATGVSLGAAALCAGLALRFWGAGYLVKNERLTVAGPYAHLRHPLYAGTLLVVAGFAFIAGPFGVALLVAAVLPAFFLYYLPYKDRVESARLERRYDGRYALYRAAVPALLPGLVAWTPPPGFDGAGGTRWSWRRCVDNGELGTLVGVVVGLALLGLRGAWWA